MIFLLEDDDSIRELICYSLSKTGMEARGFATPAAFRNALREQVPELLLLDIMLPEQDGISVLRQLRAEERTRRLPVIMLTAKSTEFDKVSALDAGADDYITKPFGVMELLARVKALLRRTGKEEKADTEKPTYTVGPLTVNCAAHTVCAAGRDVQLTYKEFELLTFLLEHRGTVLTRDMILQSVWGYEFDGENRTVDVHIRTLRQKLGSECGALIETVRGLGYKIGGSL